MHVSNKAQIGSDLRRDKRPRNSTATGRQLDAIVGSHSEKSSRVTSVKHGRHDEQVAAITVRNEISPEVEDWLNRVVLPILKKVIFNV